LSLIENASLRRRVELLLLAGLCALFFFSHLNGFGLTGSDEPRYAQVAREMCERGDWVTPYLYGQPWLEKPIGYYWAAMTSYKLFGVSDLAARLPVALCAALMVFALYGILRRVRPNEALDGGLAVASSALIFGFARGASTDMMLAAPFAIAMLSWFAWSELNEKRWLILGWAMLGAATLAKGPVAPFLATLILLAYCAARREWSKFGRSFNLTAMLVFLAVTLPWYVLVQLRTPQFFDVFILHHNLGRFASNEFRHKQPFFFYLPVLLAGAAPWTVLLVGALIRECGKLRAKLKQTSDEIAGTSGYGLFLLLWTALPVLFFSISQAKLPGYILPSMPAAALLAVRYAVGRREAGKALPQWLAIAQAALMAVFAAAVFFSPAWILKAPAPQMAKTLGAVAGAATLTFCYQAMRRWQWAGLRYAVLGPWILIVAMALNLDAPLLDRQTSRPAAQAIASLPTTEQQLPLYTMHVKRDYAFGLSFYLNHPTHAYEGLEISPGVRVERPRVPNVEHMLVTRQSSMADAQALFTPDAWTIETAASLDAEKLVILHIKPRP